MTQENLVLVYRILFEKTGNRTHLDAALEAIDGALEEYRKTNSADYIEKAARLREEILAAKSKL